MLIGTQRGEKRRMAVENHVITNKVGHACQNRAPLKGIVYQFKSFFFASTRIYQILGTVFSAVVDYITLSRQTEHEGCLQLREARLIVSED